MSVRNAEKDLMNKHIDFFPKHRRFTNRLSIQVSEQLKKCRSIKSIAKDNNMSPPMAAKIINEIDFKTRKLPEVLAIDEFRGNAEGEKFQYLLADPKNHKVVAILPDTIHHHLLKYNNRKDVKFVVKDRTGGYRTLIRDVFPQAKIIVDKYHYVRQITMRLNAYELRNRRNIPNNGGNTSSEANTYYLRTQVNLQQKTGCSLITCFVFRKRFIKHMI